MAGERAIVVRSFGGFGEDLLGWMHHYLHHHQSWKHQIQSSATVVNEAAEQAFNALLLESQSLSAAADTTAARQLLESELGSTSA